METQKVQQENYSNGTLYSLCSSYHGGWSKAEDKLLFEEVKRIRMEGQPLIRAFDNIANVTGRKSNSIRNYYYMRIRDADIATEYAPYVEQTASFVPFDCAEVKMLLRTILTDQAKGISVRACTAKLGKGDTTQMLRYQNKYRSVIKSNPELVKSVLEELKNEGIPAFDPYAVHSGKKLGRPCKQHSEKLVDVMAGTVSILGNVEGLNVSALFESLGALALSAANGANAIKKLELLEQSDVGNTLIIEQENRELKGFIEVQNKEFNHTKELLSSLTCAYSRLLKINESFLELTGVAKVSSLSTYIRDLSHIVPVCKSASQDIAMV